MLPEYSPVSIKELVMRYLSPATQRSVNNETPMLYLGWSISVSFQTPYSAFKYFNINLF